MYVSLLAEICGVYSTDLFCVASCSPTEKKQLAVVKAACSLLGDRVAANAVSQDVADKVGGLVSALTARNFVAANNIQTVSEIILFLTVYLHMHRLQY
jgi:hypothetical protein